MVQEVTDLQVMGHSIPLIQMLFTRTGAVPLMTATLPDTVTEGLTEKEAEGICEAILTRAEFNQLLMAVVFSTLNPLATKVLYLASIRGPLLATVSGPLTNSCMARKYMRRNFELANILASLPSSGLSRNRFWPGLQEPLFPSTMLKSNIMSE